MQKLLIVSLLLVAASFTMAGEYSVALEPVKEKFSADEIVRIKVKFSTASADAVWDTYLYFVDSRKTPVYISLDGNTLSPRPLQMLPPEIRLRPTFWRNDEKVQLFVCLCYPHTNKVLAISRALFAISALKSRTVSHLPMAAQLLLVQKTADVTNRAYTDYKQFDSRWKNTTMGSSNGTTIGTSGCAISSAANIRGITPASINSELQSDGGYSGNSIIWSSVRNLSYKGSGSISDSLFSSYHVIANVGGHFVLLTGQQSSGNYYSHDPGKSSNPVYSSSQVYSVRLYYK